VQDTLNSSTNATLKPSKSFVATYPIHQAASIKLWVSPPSIKVVVPCPLMTPLNLKVLNLRVPDNVDIKTSLASS
jgi:hypothetical protein